MAVKQVNTTMPIKEHEKHSYKLRGLNISHANHVWSTDITYIKIAGGMVYMAAIIDWHSKAVLLHKISSTMCNPPKNLHSVKVEFSYNKNIRRFK